MNNENLAVFVGAGVSRLVGCMGWDELARKLVAACHDAGYINYKEKEALSAEGDHRKTITVCHHILAVQECNPELFYDHLSQALTPDTQRLGRYPIYQELYNLRAVFVTTNADENFSELFNQEALVYRAEDFPGETIDRTKLYHIHGLIKDRESLIFSLEDYIRHHRKPKVKNFLQALFSKYTILFVG